MIWDSQEYGWDPSAHRLDWQGTEDKGAEQGTKAVTLMCNMGVLIARLEVCFSLSILIISVGL